MIKKLIAICIGMLNIARAGQSYKGKSVSFYFVLYETKLLFFYLFIFSFFLGPYFSRFFVQHEAIGCLLLLWQGKKKTRRSIKKKEPKTGAWQQYSQIAIAQKFQLLLLLPTYTHTHMKYSVGLFEGCYLCVCVNFCCFSRSLDAAQRDGRRYPADDDAAERAREFGWVDSSSPGGVNHHSQLKIGEKEKKEKKISNCRCATTVGGHTKRKRAFPFFFFFFFFRLRNSFISRRFRVIQK